MSHTNKKVKPTQHHEMSSCNAVQGVSMKTLKALLGNHKHVSVFSVMANHSKDDGFQLYQEIAKP